MGTFADTANHRLPFIVNRLPTKAIKCPFSVSSCSKQTEVCCFCFPFAENKWKLPFPVSSVIPFVEYQKHGDKDMETETWSHGEMDMDSWRNGHRGIKQKREAKVIFPYSVYHLLIMQTDVCCLSVC
jgi:hypothetical protein